MADCHGDLVGDLLLGMPLDLVNDDEPLLTIPVDREGRATTRTKERVALVHGPLDILRGKCSVRA